MAGRKKYCGKPEVGDQELSRELKENRSVRAKNIGGTYFPHLRC